MEKQYCEVYTRIGYLYYPVNPSPICFYRLAPSHFPLPRERSCIVCGTTACLQQAVAIPRLLQKGEAGDSVSHSKVSLFQD